MVSHSLLSCLLCLSLSLACSASFCSYSAPDGSFFEFAGLARCLKYKDTSSSWLLSLCCPIAPNATEKANVACNKGTGKCYGNSFISNGVELQYGGEVGATTPSFEFLAENPSGHLSFLVRAKQACADAALPKLAAGPVNVFLVPHTHDDVGWLTTIDGYYYSVVRDILNTVVSSLDQNPNRTFIYVEQAYFWRWWNDVNVTDAQRATFNKIYKNGQFEFVIGGWVMQDEACTTYGADINQMTLGHQFLYTTFGARPTKGWQIDPFGASSVTPTLNKLAGFDAHLIDRITDKDYYKKNKLLQFNWQGSPSLGAQVEIFSEIMDGGTNAYCDWFVAFDFDKIPVDKLDVKLFAEIFKVMTYERLDRSLTNNVLAQWGCDFAFGNATKLFENMDVLVAYLQSIEDDTGLYVKYTTLSDYYSAVMNTPNITWPSNHGGDFFPLLEELYWTGYFTSRSVLKGMVRQGEATALAAEQIYSMGRVLTTVDSASAYDLLSTLRIANADAQHHDGVTGTSEPFVVEMYANDLTNGMANALEAAAPYLSALVTGGSETFSADFSAVLKIQAGQIIPLVFYNGLGWDREEYVIIPTNAKGFTLVDQNQQSVPYQVNPAYFVNALGQYNMFFIVSVPALGYSTYFISLNASALDTSKEVPVELGADTLLQNEYITLNISGSTGLISQFSNKKSNIDLTCDQNILEYVSEKDRSGAYAFTPKGPAAPITSSPPKSIMVVGDLLTEVFQVLPAPGSTPVYAKQVIRVYQANGNPNVENFAEIGFEIGVLPDHIEIISRFATSIASGGKFFSDDNGFEYQQRTYDSKTIGGNHLPLLYASGISDSTSQFTVIADRTHSCSSLSNGEFEVMLHRNPNYTDHFGPALTDYDVTHPVIRLVVDTPANIKPYFLNFPLVPFVGSPVTSPNQKWNYTSSFLNAPVPYNVHILSVNALNNNTTQTILRFTHLFAVGEDPKYSQPVSIDVSQLFSQVTVVSFVETTLTANAIIQDPSPLNITLSAKQIRTFIAQFK